LQLIFYVDAAGGFRELVKPVQACFGGLVSLAASLFFEREKKQFFVTAQNEYSRETGNVLGEVFSQTGPN